MRNILTATLLFVLLVTTISVAQPTFTKNVNASLVINQIGGTKEGGAVWADFDNDGNLDVAVNTGNSGSSNTSLFQNNGDGTFTDVTSTYINDIGTGNDCCERSLAWGDLNNDGFIDLIGNTYNQIEIYLNRGTDTTPNFMFGVGAGMTPNMVITSMTDGMNSEGIGVMDYDNDGWLDLVFENDQHGIDIFRNDKTGTRGSSSTFFTQVTTDATGNLGLPDGNHGSGNQGDYLATGDYNNDGYMDILARKEIGTRDLWTNDQDGTFTANTSFLEGATNNKGGVVFCDFDTDGDFDLFV
ncbi:MAG: VCBS repeat-containing protein, partial [Cyclobacteriaceae bacterium]|nr:VCBS repeat-containing protein [Cyclobacteriaceae bacterium]